MSREATGIMSDVLENEKGDLECRDSNQGPCASEPEIYTNAPFAPLLMFPVGLL